jgi:hypothetical protein
MDNVSAKGTTYSIWHRVVLSACILLAFIGTVMVIGSMMKISDVILEYGGNIGAPFYLVAIMGILSIWLFSGSAAILVYIARNSRDIAAAMKNMLPGAETKAATEE